MTIKDFSVGQTAYMYCVGSNVRRYINGSKTSDYIKEVVVVSVGKKLVTVQQANSRHIIKFDASNDFCQKTAYSADYALFLTKQDIYDYVEANELYTRIQSNFNSYRNHKSYTVEQLRSVCDILNIDRSVSNE